tara:strand:- start:211 stop:1023 length:813 start_codon:yes stop_codon:yes gene_type:complete
MYLLFDIGATKTRIALSKDRETLHDAVIFDTDQNFEKGMQNIFNAVKRLTRESITGIAGGVTGTLARDKQVLTRSPNLSGWVEKEIDRAFEDEFKCPAFIENDAAIVGLGEAVAGAGMGKSIVMYVTVSTGVGGVRIVDGEIDEHSLGFEPGNSIIDMEHTLEELVSGSALEERFGKKAHEIPQDDFVWEELAEKLAYGLHNSMVHWSPDVIVLGGGMIVGDPAIPVLRIEKYLKDISKTYPMCPPVKKAQLGTVGGLHGALHYLKSRMD